MPAMGYAGERQWATLVNAKGLRWRTLKGYTGERQRATPKGYANKKVSLFCYHTYNERTIAQFVS